MSERGCFWIFHDWGKWEQYVVTQVLTRDLFGVEYDPPLKCKEILQKRVCLKCGLMQQREV